MKIVQHKNIVNLIDIIESSQNVNLVMEVAGTLTL